MSHNNSDEEYQDTSSINSIEEEIKDAISTLPDLQTKIKAIAINSYIKERREIDEKMEEEIEKVQLNYRQLMLKSIKEINDIVDGSYQIDDIELMEMKEFLTEEEGKFQKLAVPQQQIPLYWFKVLQNSDLIRTLIQERDEPILKNVTKIEGEKSSDLSKLTLTFYFKENEWFSNEKIEKILHLHKTEIKKSESSQIYWKEGKNVTVKMVKSKKKKVLKQKKQKSFFNFFDSIDNSSSAAENEADCDDLEEQFEIADHIYSDLIPDSFEYYLNIIPQNEDEESEDTSESSNEQEEEQLGAKYLEKKKK